MNLPRRKFLHLATGAAVLPAVTSIGWALDYPTRPVRIIAGFPPGGGVDINARHLGTEAVVRASPDGYTLLLATAANAVNATLYEKLNFNFIRETTPVGSISRVPNIMAVHPSLPVNTVQAFIAYAKAKPGGVSVASEGSGAAGHMAGELFKKMAGVDLLHVPYRGAAPALTDLMGGQVQVMFPTMPASTQYVRIGKLRALAVTSATRSEALPDVPSVGEFVPGYEATTWYGLAAPGKTPAEIVDKLNKEINAALADPKLSARLADFGAEPMVMSPADFGKFIAEETEKWGKVIKFAGIKAE